ncbi:hypothetical protein [Methyloceanibacter sp.]|uniref:hypothetical protein n=1 Tax=Methyloceanibacter sp. TaxID=1965321 RepID=UPI00208391BF|nr:hypothetical protein [Methyloceanibacter sp.]GFO80658.1 MAG: hypothetical protein A49_02850 [Methyloceanibacter sp.]HML92717.1 hypothetical protein [Methyloceanibacter sp.]
MRKIFGGMTMGLALALTGPAFGQAEPDGFQQDEQPGSEFELDVNSDGKVEFGRESTLEGEGGKPPAGEGMSEAKRIQLDEENPLLDPLDDPDSPGDPDPIDEELPGEGPESLSGPDDEDPLPY